MTIGFKSEDERNTWMASILEAHSRIFVSKNDKKSKLIEGLNLLYFPAQQRRNNPPTSSKRQRPVTMFASMLSQQNLNTRLSLSFQERCQVLDG